MLPGLDLREVEDVADELQQVLAGGLHALGVGDDLGHAALAGLVAHELDVAEDRVERGAQLVAHVREEGRLRRLAWAAASAALWAAAVSSPRRVSSTLLWRSWACRSASARRAVRAALRASSRPRTAARQARPTMSSIAVGMTASSRRRSKRPSSTRVQAGADRHQDGPEDGAVEGPAQHGARVEDGGQGDRHGERDRGEGDRGGVSAVRPTKTWSPASRRSPRVRRRGSVRGAGGQIASASAARRRGSRGPRRGRRAARWRAQRARARMASVAVTGRSRGRARRARPGCAGAPSASMSSRSPGCRSRCRASHASREHTQAGRRSQRPDWGPRVRNSRPVEQTRVVLAWAGSPRCRVAGPRQKVLAL